jgi:hypothetical protein
MTDRMDEALDRLREAIFEMYAVIGAQTTAPRNPGVPPHCRASTIYSMGSHLSHSRPHLELLELLFAYWREAEVEALAPAPDTVQ